MTTQTFTIGQRITYPASAYHGTMYPDLSGTVVSISGSGYLRVQFDVIKTGDVRTICPSDL